MYSGHSDGPEVSFDLRSWIQPPAVELPAPRDAGLRAAIGKRIPLEDMWPSSNGSSLQQQDPMVLGPIRPSSIVVAQASETPEPMRAEPAYLAPENNAL